MAINKLLPIVQIIIGSMLIAAIIVQSKGSGISNPMSSTGKNFSTLRGPEKVFFILTIILVILFLVSSFLNILFV